jgi:hypothetical protein
MLRLRKPYHRFLIPFLHLRREDLGRASELFLTGTTSEVLPVVRVDGRAVADQPAARVATRNSSGEPSRYGSWFSPP